MTLVTAVIRVSELPDNRLEERGRMVEFGVFGKGLRARPEDERRRLEDLASGDQLATEFSLASRLSRLAFVRSLAVFRSPLAFPVGQVHNGALTAIRSRRLLLGPRDLAGGANRFMSEFLHSAWAAVLLWCTVLAMLVSVGVYIVGRFRGGSGEAQRPSHQLLSNFREMHSQGGLSDQEFRTIKTLLRDQIQDELKDTEDKG
jgi:hypothetical protein